MAATGEARSALSPYPPVPEQEFCAEPSQVTVFPRTMSGDDLHAVVGILEVPPAENASWPRTMSGENLQQMVGIETLPDPPQPDAYWPPTVSGHDSHFVAGVRSVIEEPQPQQQLISSQWPRAMDGDGCNYHAMNTPCLASVPTKERVFDSYGSLALPHWQRNIHGEEFDSLFGSPIGHPAIQPDRPPQQCQPMPLMPPPPPPEVAPMVFSAAAVPPPPPMSAEPGVNAVLKVSLAEAIPEPEVGTRELPTLGSAGHRQGTCKPCAFLHTKGCNSGKDCTFCHLCEPGEKKRRQKEKKEMRKEMIRMQQQTHRTEELAPPVNALPPR